MYKDLGLKKSGFPAEHIANSSVICVKTHEYGPATYRRFATAILLVRSPEKAILAEFNRQSGGHLGFASMERFTRDHYWPQFMHNKLQAWETMNLSWLNDFKGRLKVVFYDDLVEDLEPTLRDILEFINHPVDEALLACAVSRREGIYKRRKRLIRFDPYTPEMHEKIAAKEKEVFRKLGRLS